MDRLDVAEQALDLRGQRLGFRRDQQPPLDALKETQPETLFEEVQRLGHRRLRDVQQASGSGYRTGLRNGTEYREMSDVDHVGTGPKPITVR